MMMRKLLAGAALTAFLAGSVFAQTTQPTTPAPARPAPAAPAAPATAPAARPAPAPAPAATTAARPAQTQKINLNTANAADLDKLPQIGEARAKAIIEARAKGRFKDWNDFVARNVVPKNAEDAIKDRVSF